MSEPLTLTWPGGEHRFLLRLGELRALQDRCDAGPEEVYNRLRGGTWRIDDLRHVLRLGLIGGGMETTRAANVINAAFEGPSLVDLKLPALAVMAHALLGPEDDMPGKPDGATGAPENGDSAALSETDR